ncbi:uncharacterized protein LOC105164450 [Sesamum indicum]|uniref:Uncharacterized protein LOC105164450 n=1 Tax=Sesamum indicum TaxID=4182 RepID=A0A6I9TKH0_SESIN|nr:uncharacterized protein LOC105164450 [Sesamum indicum]
MERVSGNASARALARGRGLTSSEAGSSNRGMQRREPTISKAKVDHVGKQIASLAKQIDELKKRGELVAQNRNSPFDNKIVTQVVDPNFRMPDLPNYDGMKDPLEHVSAFELVMNLYGQPSPIMAKLFVTTLTGKTQEWFTSLPCGIIKTCGQLLQKFKFHFASKRKHQRSTTYLFTIRQREDESLKSFMGRFNNETLKVQDLRIDMMVSILIHGLRKGSLASVLARDPPTDVEQLMAMAKQYIDEEEMNIMKDGEWWSKGCDHTRDFKKGGSKQAKFERGMERLYRPNYHNYTPLATTQKKTLMMVEKANVLKWPPHIRARGHDTEDCFQLKDEIERLVKEGGPSGGDSKRARKRYERGEQAYKRAALVMNVDREVEITFGRDDGIECGSHNDPLVIKMDIANLTVHKVLIDNDNSTDIIFKDVITKMGLNDAKLDLMTTPL